MLQLIINFKEHIDYEDVYRLLNDYPIILRMTHTYDLGEIVDRRTLFSYRNSLEDSIMSLSKSKEDTDYAYGYNCALKDATKTMKGVLSK